MVTACWSADVSQRSADKSARKVVQWSRLVCCGLRISPADTVMQMEYKDPMLLFLSVSYSRECGAVRAQESCVLRYPQVPSWLGFLKSCVLDVVFASRCVWFAQYPSHSLILDNLYYFLKQTIHHQK